MKTAELKIYAIDISLLSFMFMNRSSAQGCIPRVNVCDGNKDCSEGEDEATCVALAPEIPVNEDALG